MLRCSRLILILLGLFLPVCLGATEPPAGFSVWVEQFREEAVALGISSGTVDFALRDVGYLPFVIEADRRQPEFKKSLSDYLATALSEERVTQGRRLLHRHWNLLQKIAAKYRVQPHYLVALWGIETGYGQHSGQIPVGSALATLAYDARRSDYFRRELINLLKIIDSGKLGKVQPLGSWAGAMGQLQFMPSTYLGFAEDGDGDGRIDLWGSREDCLASAANYLAKSGWQWHQKWGRRVSVPTSVPESLTGLENSAPLRAWRQRGVRLIDGRPLPHGSLDASLILPEGRSGEAFLVYDNYRVLLKWNRAHSFAVAVGLLADRIAGEGN